MNSLRPWTTQETNVAFALFEELRETDKVVRLTEIAWKVKSFLEVMARESDTTAFSYRQVYNKLVFQGMKIFPKPKKATEALLEFGLFASFSESQRGQMRKDLQAARQLLRGCADGNDGNPCEETLPERGRQVIHLALIIN
ncbi:uncharacterized protein PV07_08863 [Cladophialophora immunda]|uniref:Uncharacterized protein n=1 Tax=Cladophialophora immunda TaxID=569365 RepID=A0A0D1ZD73_9EURO|nr:uncharacterized protein PV07_08863 [Cladophialophora immunda]KIW25706.1 hypothetical protein PV07_08863 [Cladophialophora immunda]